MTIPILLHQPLLIMLHTTLQWILILTTKHRHIILIPVNMQQPRLFTTCQQIPNITLERETITIDYPIVCYAHDLLFPPDYVIVLGHVNVGVKVLDQLLEI